MRTASVVRFRDDHAHADLSLGEYAPRPGTSRTAHARGETRGRSAPNDDGGGAKSATPV